MTVPPAATAITRSGRSRQHRFSGATCGLRYARGVVRSEEGPTYPVGVGISEPMNRPGSDELAVGERVARYVLVERIGEGGMGVVWAAHDPELDRKVAVKLV